jgi:hypothetical protein
MQEDAYSEERQWAQHVREFGWKCLKKIPGWIGGGCMAVISWSAQIAGATFSKWFVLFSGMAAGAVISAFCVWRDERKTLLKERQNTSEAIEAKDAVIAALKGVLDDRAAEKMEVEKKRGREIYDNCLSAVASGKSPLQALIIAGAADFDTNADVIRLCSDLVRFGHEHPFDMLNGAIREEGYLEFLQVARLRGKILSRVSIYEDALDMMNPPTSPS